MHKSQIVVSVVILTYGHENYIEQAINGVLMQECNFEVELIITNDCSPDKTDALIIDIIKTHPKTSWIKYIRHEKNIGAMSNFVFTLKEAKGKYIAICDGDDYWTDPLKLQKQVDFLEANKEFVLVSHKRNIIENNKIIKENEEGFFSQCILFKNIIDKIFLDFDSSKIINLDTFLMLFLENFGKFHMMDFTGSVYRLGNQGVWSKIDIERKFYLSQKSLKEMQLFFKLNNLNKSILIIKDYELDNYLRFSKRLKENKHYYKSFNYLLIFIAYTFYYNKFSINRFKSIIHFLFNENKNHHLP
jgi:glycosyltransferase involved in cell wall biosynthesis